MERNRPRLRGLLPLGMASFLLMPLPALAAAPAWQDRPIPELAQAAGQDRPTSQADSTFATKAVQGNMAEVALGQLAVRKAASDDVRRFGQMMIDDHSRALQEVQQAASRLQLDVPRTMSAKHAALAQRLGNLSGAEFDKAYIEEMVKDHKEDIELFRRQAQTGDNPALKNLAARTLPMLERHLTEAQRIANNLGIGGQ